MVFGQLTVETLTRPSTAGSPGGLGPNLRAVPAGIIAVASRVVAPKAGLPLEDARSLR
jgi:hypothetical protein